MFVLRFKIATTYIFWSNSNGTQMRQVTVLTHWNRHIAKVSNPVTLSADIDRPASPFNAKRKRWRYWHHLGMTSGPSCINIRLVTVIFIGIFRNKICTLSGALYIE